MSRGAGAALWDCIGGSLTYPTAGLEIGAVGGDGVAVPVGGVFGDAALGGVIRIDQADADGVAHGPLEVVGEAPLEVAAEGDAIGAGTLEFAQVAMEIVDALWVVHPAIQRDDVGVLVAVLG